MKIKPIPMINTFVNKSNLFMLVVLCCFLFSGCKSREEKEAQVAKELITVKTLGLAYLEEFELDNAEKQFLRFIELAPKEKLGYANLGLVYLRMGKYPEAEKQLMKAIKIDPKDPDILHILATVYKMEDNTDKAIAVLQKALTLSPGHVKVLYDLTEIIATRQDTQSQMMRTQYLVELKKKAPGNLVPQLNLTDIYIRKGNFDTAIAELEVIKKQYPDFPAEAVEYYNNALKFLKKGDRDNAIIQFTVFHNYLKVTSPYQAGIMDLKGPGGSLIGFPLITFDQQASGSESNNSSKAGIVTFKDVSATVGIDILPATSPVLIKTTIYSHIEASDFDNDGDIDLYAGCYDATASTYKHFLFSNEMGRYTDISKEAGLTHSGREFAATFADYDNDGFLDLFILKEGGNKLYRNAGAGKFEDVSAKAGIGNKTVGNKALFFDLDHDGDLDLLIVSKGANLLYRNNADGTFTEQAAKMGIAGTGLNGTDAAFGDFDEDGDIDFLVTHDQGSVALYFNQRQGVFKNMVSGSGLEGAGNARSVAVGDYNNDGFLDLLFTTVRGFELYTNLKDGKFRAEEKSNKMFGKLKAINGCIAKFIDFDNDGHLDLLMSGESETATLKGLYLYHNNGKGIFSETTGILPGELHPIRQISPFDYNDDGDVDIALAGVHGGLYLLRNDGGNNNHFIKMKLMGLKAGSAKNNHFGIGAKVEVRSGELYQTTVVTDPNVLFGIGNRSQADIVRITWTNGVPQNIFMPGTDQSLVESQTLKGSCPFLYAWDGKQYAFVKDILWRSALGMPLGIMGATTKYGFADASDDYLKISGDQIKPQNGKYTLQVTSELWETIYFDKLELIAVDHPDSVDVYVPEQFTPPPFPGDKLYAVHHKITPVSARDEQGKDVLSFIRAEDDVYLSDFKPAKYQGIVETKELILDPGKDILSDNLMLFMNGWIFPTDASINVALSQNSQIQVQSPVIQVLNKQGKWVTVIDNLGFPMGKDKTVIADLSGKFLCADHRVKIATNMEIYWDNIFFAPVLPKSPVIHSKMQPVLADLHYRGFSESYRKGGRYGPHWFDYQKVSQDTKWRDLTGNYTRYGDVLPLLTGSDNQYIISNAGDETTVVFETGSLPALKKGWKRDFLIHCVGWVKDGDLNTATGNTVLPLPFHNMGCYPPEKADQYPSDPALVEYNRKYNTRVVSTESYVNALKDLSEK
jgi:hypothetical protein